MTSKFLIEKEEGLDNLMWYNGFGEWAHCTDNAVRFKSRESAQKEIDSREMADYAFISEEEI